MRIFGMILASYIILLSGIPCCIIDDCPDDKMEQMADHPEENDDCGTCSPFFSCEGCAAATITFQLSQFEFTSAPSIPPDAGHRPQLSLPEQHFDFWQPPRFV